MKKSIMTAILIATILLIFISTRLNNNENENLDPNNELINKISPLLEEYCNTLDKLSTGSECPTCLYYHPTNKELDYEQTNDINEKPFEKHLYIIEKDGDIDNLTLKLLTKFGSNTKKRTQVLSFTFDKDKNIINSDMPIAECA